MSKTEHTWPDEDSPLLYDERPDLFLYDGRTIFLPPHTTRWIVIGIVLILVIL